MSIRKKLNNQPILSSAIAIVVVLGAAYVIYSAVAGGEKRFYGATAYYSDDDGKTYFKDNAFKPVPYTDNGKEVVRAFVYSCPSKGEFVAFLQRYTPEGIKAINEVQSAKKEGKEPSAHAMAIAAQADSLASEFKKPGAGNPWKRGASGGVVAGNIMDLCDNKPGEIAKIVIP